MKAVAIVSGGIDSTVLLHHAVKNMRLEVYPITFSYGQKHHRELEYAMIQCRSVVGKDPVVISLPFLDHVPSALTSRDIPVPHIKEVLGHPQPSTYVPFRNQLFLTIACAFAEAHGADSVLYGAQAHDLYGYWDTTREFVLRFNRLVTLNRLHEMEVLAPLIDNSKADNIRLGMALGVDFAQTYSCYEGRTFHCGVCATCAERRKGFKDLGLEDPTPYETHKVYRG